jgi:uncharacterized protein YeaO (DUF488 family)
LIRLKRVYEAPSEDEGLRILVDRLRPRGITKGKAGIDLWVCGLAPSMVARSVFCHDPEKWDEFKARYAGEFEEKGDAVTELERSITCQVVIFVFAAKETELNNAVALKGYLEIR